MISGIGAFDFKAVGGASALTPSGPATATEAVDAAGSFAAVLSDLATRTVDTLEHAEQVSAQGLQGQADTREVAGLRGGHGDAALAEDLLERLDVDRAVARRVDVGDVACNRRLTHGKPSRLLCGKVEKVDGLHENLRADFQRVGHQSCAGLAGG